MKIMNRKGQGGDTFKLLIAAVVAMVILGIVTGVFQNIWATVGTIQCVTSPINELVTKIQKAQAGINTATDAICMKDGESFEADAIIDKVTNLRSLTFECDGAVCDTGPIEVTGDTIEATGDAKFSGLISCSGSSGDYECDIRIRSA